MSWKFFADIRETFVELTAQSSKGTSLFIRALNRKDQMTSGLKEALSFLPTEIDLKETELTLRTDLINTFWQEQWYPNMSFVATDGFEHVFETGDQSRTELFSLKAHKPTAPFKMDFCFGVTERTDAQGKTHSAVKISELEFIHSKLKLTDTKNILVSFLHSPLNPENEKQAVKFFTEQGYRVESAHMYPGNEFERARLGAFTLAEKSSENILKKEILALGFSDFKMAGHSDQTLNFFEDQITVGNNRLKLSPMSALIIDSEGVPQIKYENISSEPGPVCFGKGVELCVLDLLALKHQFKFEDIKRLKIDHARTKKYLQLFAQRLRTNSETVIDGYLKLFKILLQIELSSFEIDNLKIQGWLSPFLMDGKKAVNNFEKEIGKLIHD